MLPCGSAADAPSKTSAPPCKSIFKKPDSTSLPMSSCDMPSLSEANAARKTSKVASQARRISSSSCGDLRPRHAIVTGSAETHSKPGAAACMCS